MKENLKFLYEIKALGCMFFAGEVFIYAAISYINGTNYINITTLFQLLFLAFIIVMFQYFVYSYDRASKISIYIRTIIHYISMLSIFIISSNIFKLFDLSNKENLLKGTMYFTIIYIITFLSMAIYYKITGERFNKKLSNYKNK